MTEHKIPRVDWTYHLANTIERAKANDTIVCHSESMRKLGERARLRLCCEKPLTFELELKIRFDT